MPKRASARDFCTATIIRFSARLHLPIHARPQSPAIGRHSSIGPRPGYLARDRLSAAPSMMLAGDDKRCPRLTLLPCRSAFEIPARWHRCRRQQRRHRPDDRRRAASPKLLSSNHLAPEGRRQPIKPSFCRRATNGKACPAGRFSNNWRRRLIKTISSTSTAI